MDCWGCGKGRAADKDQSHLHSEGEESPDSPTPMFNDFERGLVADRHSEECCHKSEDDGKDKRLGEPALHKFDTKFNHSRPALDNELFYKLL